MLIVTTTKLVINYELWNKKEHDTHDSQAEEFILRLILNFACIWKFVINKYTVYAHSTFPIAWI